MSIFLLCIKIFLVRIIDVTLGTIRTIYTVKDKTVKVIVVENGAEQGRKFFDKMNEFAISDEVGAKGLAWTKFEQDGTIAGGIAKFITEDMKSIRFKSSNE